MSRSVPAPVRVLALTAPPLAALIRVLGGGNYYCDSDYYWHIALGRVLARTGRLPGADGLSWAAQQQGLEYVNHSWLADWLLYRLSLWGPTEIAGAVVYLAGCLALLALALFGLWGRGLLAPGQRLAHRLADGAVILGVWLCLRYTWGNPRPQQLALVLFALALYLLRSAWEHPHRRRCFLLPALAALWANLHGGSLPLLLGMTGLYGLLALLPPFQRGSLCHRRGAPARRFALLLGLEALAGCCNPYGPRLYGQFFQVDATSALVGVTEWQPAAWDNAPAFFAAMGLLALVWLLARRPFELESVAPLLLTAGFTLLHVRGMFWWCVCAAAFLLRQAPALRAGLERVAGRFRPGRLRPLARAAGRALFPLVTAATLAAGACFAPAALHNRFYRVFPPGTGGRAGTGRPPAAVHQLQRGGHGHPGRVPVLCGFPGPAVHPQDAGGRADPGGHPPPVRHLVHRPGADPLAVRRGAAGKVRRGTDRLLLRRAGRLADGLRRGLVHPVPAPGLTRRGKPAPGAAAHHEKARSADRAFPVSFRLFAAAALTPGRSATPGRTSGR